MVRIYHYTDRKGLEGIISSKKIKAQLPHGGEANMPFGVYLTEKPPQTSTKDLLINNFDDMRGVLDNPALKEKVNFFIAVNSEDLPKANKRQTKGDERNEWVVPHDIDVEEILKVGQRAGQKDGPMAIFVN